MEMCALHRVLAYLCVTHVYCCNNVLILTVTTNFNSFFFNFKLRKSVRACERIVLRALFTLLNNSDEMEMS